MEKDLGQESEPVTCQLLYGKLTGNLCSSEWLRTSPLLSVSSSMGEALAS